MSTSAVDCFINFFILPLQTAATGAPALHSLMHSPSKLSLLAYEEKVPKWTTITTVRKAKVDNLERENCEKDQVTAREGLNRRSVRIY